MSNQAQSQRSEAVVLTGQLETPRDDTRLYKRIVLPNQLEVLLVHDATTDKASAAMSVGVGYFSDDKDMPGMAHAAPIIHILFWKIPWGSRVFTTSLSVSGSYNASTHHTTTNYHFDINSSGDLYGALDRFAHGFIDPKFSPEFVDRELIAIDSEHNKNKRIDWKRIEQLEKSTSNPNYPWSQFVCGTYDTLKTNPEARGVNVYEKFLGHYKKHYSANRMKLVILGSQQLDVLEDRANLFAGIPNSTFPFNLWEVDVPLRPEDVSTQTFAKLVMNQNWVDLEFPFPDERPYLKCQSSQYISHLLCHKGPGSLFSYLKPKGVIDISTEMYEMCPGALGIFLYRIYFTELDESLYQEAVNAFFQYIYLLKKTPPQEWIFQELMALAQRAFDLTMMKAIEFTETVSQKMQTPLPVEWLLSGYRPREFDEDIILKGLAYFRPDNLKMTVASHNFPGQWSQREKWYGTEFTHEKMPTQFLDQLQTSVETQLPELHLPGENLFLSEALRASLVSKEEPAFQPRLIRHDPTARVWYKRGLQVPEQKKDQAYLVIHCRTPLAHATVTNFAKAKLYEELIEDALKEYSYDASLLRTTTSVTSDPIGIKIRVVGDRAIFRDLLEKVLMTMINLQVEENFEVVQGRLTRFLDNYGFMRPCDQVFWFNKSLEFERWYTEKEIRLEVQHITAGDIAQFFPNLLRKMHMEVLVGGEICEKQALGLSLMVERIFKPIPLPQTEWPVAPRSIHFAPAANFVYHETLEDVAAIDQCIQYLLFAGDRFDGPTRAKILLLGQMTRSGAFDQLRTKEQLGYLVWSFPRGSGTNISYAITIQGKETPAYMEERIECFLADFAETLAKMSDHDFDIHKESLTEKQLKKLKSETLEEEANRFWAPIQHGHLDFLLHEHDATNVQKLTKDDMVEFYNYFILPSSSSRAKLVIHLKTQEHMKTQIDKGLAVGDVKSFGSKESGKWAPVLITDVGEFKSMMKVKAAPQPVKDIKEFEDSDSV